MVPTVRHCVRPTPALGPSLFWASRIEGKMQAAEIGSAHHTASLVLADEGLTRMGYYAYNGSQPLVFVDMECPSMHRLYAAAVLRRPGSFLAAVQPREGEGACSRRDMWPCVAPVAPDGDPDDAVHGPPAAVLWLTEYEWQHWDPLLALAKEAAARSRGGATAAPPPELPPQARATALRCSNYFFTRKGLSRKAHLARHMQAHLASSPEGHLCRHKCLPDSVVINTLAVFNPSLAPGGLRVDRASALADALWEAEAAVDAARAGAGDGGGPAPLWILKPSIANKGAEVTVLDSMEVVQEVVSEHSDISEWVLQEYIARPMLLSGCKFHLRVYVLLTSALNAYMYREGQALAAVAQYGTVAGQSGGESHWGHITNTYLAQQHGAYVEADHLHLMSNTHLPCDGGLAHVWRGLRTCLAHMLHSYKGAFGALAPLPGSFELFGVDFLLREDGSPVLLEWNPGPDMGLNMGQLAPLMYRVTDDLVQVVQRDLAAPLASAGGNAARSAEAMACHVHAAGGAPGVGATMPDGVTRAELPEHEGWTVASPCNGWDCIYSQAWCASGVPASG